MVARHLASGYVDCPCVINRIVTIRPAAADDPERQSDEARPAESIADAPVTALMQTPSIGRVAK
jgi:hypothetical protein